MALDVGAPVHPAEDRFIWVALAVMDENAAVEEFTPVFQRNVIQHTIAGSNSAVSPIVARVDNVACAGRICELDFR